MLIVMPSDPTTEEASVFLAGEGFDNQVMPIPDELEYRTSATLSLYFPNDDDSEAIMMALSGKGLVIMRVFKHYHPRENVPKENSHAS